MLRDDKDIASLISGYLKLPSESSELALT